MTKILHVHVVNDGGFMFGMDKVTPVSWKFSNRVPAKVYNSFRLKPEHADNEKVQKWIARHKAVVMSYRELYNTLEELTK